MTDWQTLDAGPELDCVIAERLGHRITDHYRMMAHGPARPYVRSKDGAPLGILAFYSTDLNAAFGLLPDDEEWEMDYDKKPRIVTCWLSSGWLVSRGQAPTPALAICRAWLAWMDAKGHEA